jgi:hypothetical protein
MEGAKRGSNGVATRDKKNIFTRSCAGSEVARKFPPNNDPASWPSCQDAYEFTWLSEASDVYLNGVSWRGRLKLARSAGYCPHRRCQLDSVGSSPSPGACPPGLCYTKLQDGSPTFGACCYDPDGIFDSRGMVGNFHRQRPAQKPIYKNNVVLLGPEERFINANEVYPGIIITQCPLLGAPYDTGEEQTLADWKEMIVQEEIDTVVQLHPCGPNLASAPCLRHSDICKSPCIDWAGTIFADSSHPLSDGVTDFHRKEHALGDAVVLYSYHIRGAPVTHWWFHGWPDFEVPLAEQRPAVLSLAREIAQAAGRGKKALIVCYSGRGRSGTMASLAVGLKYKVATTDRLIDYIVELRESRDTLVETPLQFALIRQMLGLEQLHSSRTPSPVLPLLMVTAALVCTLASDWQGRRSANTIWYLSVLTVLLTLVYIL